MEFKLKKVSSCPSYSIVPGADGLVSGEVFLSTRENISSHTDRHITGLKCAGLLLEGTQCWAEYWCGQSVDDINIVPLEEHNHTQLPSCQHCGLVGSGWISGRYEAVA